MTALALNPRYAAYCRAHGRTPNEQRDHDRLQYPGGSMCGYILWIRQQIVEFSREHPDAFTLGHLTDHGAYDEWLDARFPPSRP